ncbi:MAG TPA: hypothetical protein VLG38_08185 [Gammaproteobacteria bacterium]|nr:hypothetical protein [Gammaproteobacteria bacterium]
MALPDRFPQAPKAALFMMRDYTGIKVKFQAPSDQNRTDIQSLIQALNVYDSNQSKDNVNNIIKLLKSLNMTGFRLREDPKTLIFVPIDVAAQGDGVTLLWRLGKVQASGKPETLKNPVISAFVSNEHMKKDFADNIAIRFFLECNIKGMLCNGVAFGCSPNLSPCQPPHKETDVSHSNVPLYFSAIQAIVQNYPEAPISDLHGMEGSSSTSSTKTPLQRRAIFVNNFGGQFLPNGHVSWPSLFAVAMAQQDLPPQTVAFGSRLPGAIIDSEGVHRKMADVAGSDGYFIKFDGSSNVTNVPGHVANGGDCTKKGQWLDKSLHMEWGPDYRTPGALQDEIVAAFKQALYWYVRYVPSKHNVWNLPAEINNNMRLYPAYFEKQLQLAPQAMLFSKVDDTKVVMTSHEEIQTKRGFGV